MSRAPGGAILGTMTSAPGRRPIRVDLDLVPDAEPIRGQMRAVDGMAQPFSGWLELIQLLEKARISDAPGASDM
jgi:hypothetical protein